MLVKFKQVIFYDLIILFFSLAFLNFISGSDSAEKTYSHLVEECAIILQEIMAPHSFPSFYTHNSCFLWPFVFVAFVALSIYQDILNRLLATSLTSLIFNVYCMGSILQPIFPHHVSHNFQLFLSDCYRLFLGTV